MKKLFILGLISVLLLGSTISVSAGLDETPVERTFKIPVEFKINTTGDTAIGYYETTVYGILNSHDGNYIEKVSTKHKAGARFRFIDKYSGSNKAYTTFLCYAVGVNGISFKFTIDSSGDIEMKQD